MGRRLVGTCCTSLMIWVWTLRSHSKAWNSNVFNPSVVPLKTDRRKDKPQKPGASWQKTMSQSRWKGEDRPLKVVPLSLCLHHGVVCMCLRSHVLTRTPHPRFLFFPSKFSPFHLSLLSQAVSLSSSPSSTPWLIKHFRGKKTFSLFTYDLGGHLFYPTLRVSWLYYNILTCSGMEVDSTGNGRI